MEDVDTVAELDMWVVLLEQDNAAPVQFQVNVVDVGAQVVNHSN